MEEVIAAMGHEHVAGDHQSTFEVTTDEYLTPAGDCILGIEADRAPADFDPTFTKACQVESAQITAALSVGDHRCVITGQGHPDLTFASGRAAVGRTSAYIDDQTVLIGADRAAADIDREVIAALREGRSLTLKLRVE